MVENRVEKIQKLLSESDEISRTLENKNANLDTLLKRRLPVVCCKCGFEILLVPDLKAMDIAIKSHVAKHRWNGRKVDFNEKTSGALSLLLSQLTLKKVMKVQDSHLSES